MTGKSEVDLLSFNPAANPLSQSLTQGRRPGCFGCAVVVQFQFFDPTFRLILLCLTFVPPGFCTLDSADSPSSFSAETKAATAFLASGSASGCAQTRTPILPPSICAPCA